MPDPPASDRVRALLATRRTLLADFDRGAGAQERVLVRSDLPGTFQLYEPVSGELLQLTSLPEPVATAEYVPGTRQAVVAIDAGGNERYQLYVLDLDDAAASTVAGFDRLRALTSDSRFGHRSAGVSPDGRSLAWVPSRRRCGCSTLGSGRWCRRVRRGRPQRSWLDGLRQAVGVAR